MYLVLELDRENGVALNEQIRSQVIELLRDGTLRAGSLLPSSRRLATDLGVSRSVVVESYQQLAAEGWLDSNPRSGTRVSAQYTGSRYPEEESPAPTESVRWNLVPGGPDVRSFPRREWTSCVTSVVREMSDVDLGYPPSSGLRSVRETLAAYLGRVRSVRTGPDQMMLTSGFAHGLSVACRLLLRRGIARIGLEDPGEPAQSLYLENLGMRPVPIRVDRDGIDVTALERSGVRAVLVTPLHQFPTGVALSPPRRRALVEWARTVNGLIIEDDYDGGFWYEPGTEPVSLQSMAPDHVVYGGTASKTLAPGLRLGWLSAPEALTSEMRQVREQSDLGTGVIDQLAYAEFIQTGQLAKHLRRTRETYRKRRELVHEYLVDSSNSVTTPGADAGLHTFLTFSPRVEETQFVELARRNRIALRGAREFRLAPQDTANGVVIGFAKQSDAWLIEALEILRGLITTLEKRPAPQQ